MSGTASSSVRRALRDHQRNFNYSAVARWVMAVSPPPPTNKAAAAAAPFETRPTRRRLPQKWCDDGAAVRSGEKPIGMLSRSSNNSSSSSSSTLGTSRPPPRGRRRPRSCWVSSSRQQRRQQQYCHPPPLLVHCNHHHQHRQQQRQQVALPSLPLSASPSQQMMMMMTVLPQHHQCFTTSGAGSPVEAAGAPQQSTSTATAAAASGGTAVSDNNNNKDDDDDDETKIANAIAAAVAPPFGSPDAVWRSLTRSLLAGVGDGISDDDSDDSDHPQPRQEHQPPVEQIEAVLRWWCRQRPLTSEGAAATWKLWDLCCDRWQQQQQQQQPSEASSVKRRRNQEQQQVLLSAVLDHWRWCQKQRTIEVPYTVAQVWERLLLQQQQQQDEQGKNIPLINARSYSILLSALAHEQTNNNKSNVEAALQLAETILQHALDHSNNSNSNHTAPDRRNGSDDDDDDDAASGQVVLWNSLLTVHAKLAPRAGKDAGERAEAVLRRMQQRGGVAADEISYANVLEAWAAAAAAAAASSSSSAAGDNGNGTEEAAARRAERLWWELLDGLPPISSVPSVQEAERRAHGLAHCLAPVLQAWCSAGGRGVDRAHALLRRAVESYRASPLCRGGGGNSSNHHKDLHQQEGNVDDDDTGASFSSIPPVVYPNQHCFSTVLTGYARRGQSDRVLAVLAELQTLADGDPRFLPTAATFNSVLESFATQRTPEAAAHAEILLGRLVALAASSSSSSQNDCPTTGHHRPCRPDTTSLNTCLDAWAESGAPRAAERAEALLARAASSDDDDDELGHMLRPDAYSYTTVMKAWSRDKRSPQAAERCEGILRNMWERVEEQQKQQQSAETTSRQPPAVRPNAVTYSTAVFAWAEQADKGNANAPLRAEAVFQDMLERYERTRDASLRPTLAVYSSLIFAWARSARPDSDARARLHLEELRSQCFGGDGDDALRPTAKLYNAVITCKKKRKDGAGAEEILQLMYRDFFRHSHSHAMPNRFVYHNVLAAWEQSPQPHKAYQRMRVILQQMQKEYETRGWDCRPNRVTYTLLLSCLGRVGKKEAVFECENILKQMHALSESGENVSVKPNNYCYATVLHAWSKVKNFNDAPVRAQALFDDMLARSLAGDEDLVPNKFAYQSLLSVWADHASIKYHPEAGRRALAILNEMQDRHDLDPRRNDPPAHYHYNDVLCAFARVGDVENAELVLKRMIQQQQRSEGQSSKKALRPTLGMINTLVGAYARSQQPDAMERAEQLLRSARSLTGLSPNVVTYSAYLSCWQRSGREDAYATGKTIVEEMAASTDKEAAPNAYTFGSLLTMLRDSTSIPDKQLEADYIEALMQHVGLRPTSDLLSLLHEIRQQLSQEPSSSVDNKDDGERS